MDKKFKKNFPISPRVIKLYCPLFIMIYNLAGNLSNDIYLPSLPTLPSYFHTSIFFVQMTMTAWFLGVALPQLFFGIIADKYGRRPVMLWGGVLFLVSTLLCLLSPSIYILILGRFFQGVGISSLNVATFATVKSHHYDEKTSTKLLSYLNITGILAPIIGPILGGYIYLLLGWRATFLFILMLSGSAIIGLYYFMLESYDEKNRNDLHLNIKKFWGQYRPVLFHSCTKGPMLTQSFFMAALIAYLTAAPFIMKNIFSVPIKYFGWTQMVPFGFFILGGYITIKFTNFLQFKNIIAIGFGVILFGLILLDGMKWFPEDFQIYFFIFAISIFLLGFSLVSSPLISKTMASTDLKGLASALLGLNMALMASLGSLSTAIFFHEKMQNFMIIINFFSISAIILYFYFKKSRCQPALA